MSVVAPSGVVTFLFTDIEGSTRRWEADADDMRAALAVHDELLRRIVDAHDGWLFKHTGDGVCAAFASPRSAVDAAVAAQKALELPVRMGIATGETEVRGDDYFGAVLNRAARVMAAGHGGQILVDGATAELLSGVDLLDLGHRRLRDIVKAVAVYQVTASDLRPDFPPLMTLDSTPGNLRRPTTSLVGREAELTELQTAIKTSRLVTLTGVGGVGKTRLAVEAAARLTDDFTDGVFLIELAAVTDPGAVPDAVAAVLGVTQQSGMSVADSVATALEDRARLLVFDNCEHVLDAAADMIDGIVSRSSTIRVLATSREGLRVADEQLWPVSSLVHTGIDSSAATLFVERAKAVAPSMSLLKSDDANAVVEICRRLDGMPLAIELAASRLQAMTVTEVRDRLDDRFRLLVGSRRGLERHQTLRAAVQWSYDLLDETETTLLTRCSVFAGGFDLAAAHAAAGSADEFTTLDLLDALVRKSLLVADRSTGHTRFSMLETVRQFAEEQLVNRGEAECVRTAHARYFAGLEADIFALWDSPRQRDAYRWLTRELANLRAAFRWAADHDDLDTSAIIGFYTSLLGLCSEQYEPVTWAEELVEPAKAADHPRLVQLCTTASQCYAAGRVDEAIGYTELGEAALERGGYADVPFGYEAALAAAYQLRGEPLKSVALLRKTIARSSGTCFLARATLVLALTNAGIYGEAMQIAEDLRPAAETNNNPNAKALALNAYAWAYRDADPVAAYDVGRRAMKIAHDSGNRFVESTTSIGLSRLAVSHGDPLEAIDYLALAIRNYRDSGSSQLLTGPLSMIAVFLERFGRHRPAATIMGFGDVPSARQVFPEVDTAITRLREVLGDQSYESSAHAGRSMTAAAIAAFSLDQIDRLRTSLEQQAEPL
jgi:predicted ATPase